LERGLILRVNQAGELALLFSGRNHIKMNKILNFILARTDKSRATQWKTL
jgi:hypothetical protein